jgi:2-phospho-L-lactate guanylyltransferase
MLLIPFKSLATAKQRLAEALDQQQRSQLAEAMLRDVMTAAAGVLGRIDVALVTGDARAQDMAAEFGFIVIEDRRNQSETAAIEMATAWCEQHGYDTTIVTPADIPLITSQELQRVLDAAPGEGAVFVPAYDRRGSNCILRRPAGLIPLRFGNDSFLPHCEAMKRTGKEVVILEMPGIGLDIDNPHELELLVQRDGNTHAQQLLRSWGFGEPEGDAWEAAV